MKWWGWWRFAEPEDAGHRAAREAKLQSRDELREIRAQRPEVAEVAEGLRELKRQNGFGLAAERAMRRKRA